MTPVSRGRKPKKSGGSRARERARRGQPQQARGEDEFLAPIHDFTKDVDGRLNAEELRELLARRMFAMPLVGTPEYPWLDPSDADERRILIESEHPQYRSATGLMPEVARDGVSPRLHIALHEVIAQQLWDGDPPEVWRAVQRLTAADGERHEVLHQLMAVMAPHIDAALASARSFDRAAYVAALDALGMYE